MHGAHHLIQCLASTWRSYSSVFLLLRNRCSRQMLLLHCILSGLGIISYQFSDYAYISFLLPYTKPHKPDTNKMTHSHHLSDQRIGVLRPSCWVPHWELFEVSNNVMGGPPSLSGPEHSLDDWDIGILCSCGLKPGVSGWLLSSRPARQPWSQESNARVL